MDKKEIKWWKIVNVTEQVKQWKQALPTLLLSLKDKEIPMIAMIPDFIISMSDNNYLMNIWWYSWKE